MEKINDGLTPQQRWEKKSGYITKGYRMYKYQADAFAEACKKAGVSQASKIQELMQGFVDEVNATYLH